MVNPMSASYVYDSALQSDIWRQWLFVFALLFVAGIAYVVFE